MEETKVTPKDAERIVSFGPSMQSTLDQLEQARVSIMDDDLEDRNMTVQFNLYHHAQLEKIAEFFKQSKTSVASRILEGAIGDVYRFLDLPELEPAEIRTFLERTRKARNGNTYPGGVV